VAGLFLVLPFAITFWIVYWIYSLLDRYFISPVSRLVLRIVEHRAEGVDLPTWFVEYVVPVVGVVGALAILYFLGAFARLRAAKWVDYLLLRAPLIKSIHGAVLKVIETLRGEGELAHARRIVLVSYPHPGMRVPAFVTSSCVDLETKRTILCVYVPTTPVPTSGFMLLIPEEDVTDLDWNVEETIQAVASFGITAPNHVRYHRPPVAASLPPSAPSSA
jgi:uncharacterized membrane protein